MKRRYKKWYITAGIFVLAFVVYTIYGYTQYSPHNSAPFAVWMLCNSGGFLMLASVFALIGALYHLDYFKHRKEHEHVVLPQETEVEIISRYHQGQSQGNDETESPITDTDRESDSE